MAKTFVAQVNRLPDVPELRTALEYLCTASNNLYNCTIYLARQLYFKEGKFSNGRWLSSQMKRNAHMKALYTSAAQQTCISVGEAFKAYHQLLKLWRSGGLAQKPKPPNYRRSGGMFQISYPKRWLKLIDGQVKVPMGRSCKAWFNLPEIFLDSIPIYGEKPEGWKASGRRIRRGTYRSAAGVEVNADANGAWNIGRKAKVTGMQCTPARGVLTSPKRLKIWELSSKPILTQKCRNPSGDSPLRDSRRVVKGIFEMSDRLYGSAIPPWPETELTKTQTNLKKYLENAAVAQ